MEAQRSAGDAKKPAVKTPPPDLHLYLLDEEFSEDALSSYRRREAASMSLNTHGIIIALLLLLPKWIGTQAVLVPTKEKQNTTFVLLPDDIQKVTKPPKTDIISDKDRLAQSRTPSPDKDTLRKLLDARRPGPPKPAQQPPPATQQAQQQNPATAQGAPAPEVHPTPVPQQQTAQLEAPKPSAPKKSPFTISSPGTTVSQAVQSVANGHGTSGVEYGGGGEYGSAIHPKTDRREGMEILSDTLGVDFGPYMKRLRYTVQNHWDPLIPESAMPPVMKKGVVVIEFTIDKTGKVSGMKLISSSGDVALDRAAWGAITDAIPLPNLPVQFAGQYLQIRARFYYNPDKADME
jgi:TonB family protein